jgi:hypothetical protein
MSCVLYKDGETLFCDPADMAREMAAGWSVTDPNRDDEVVNEKANKETIKDSEKPKTGQTEADEEQGERKKILGIL